MSELEFRRVWLAEDRAVESDAINFWNALGILPPDVDPGLRAKELCVAAYSGSNLVGVATATVADFSQLRSRFAFLRCAVLPGRRHEHIASDLIQHSGRLLGQWSASNPQLAVAGVAVVVESPFLESISRFPVWPPSHPDIADSTGLVLVGFTPEGKQVRVTWFRHTVLAASPQNNINS